MDMPFRFTLRVAVSFAQDILFSIIYKQLKFIYSSGPLAARRSSASHSHSCIVSSTSAAAMLGSFAPLVSVSSSFTVSWVSDAVRGGWVVTAFLSSETSTRVGAVETILDRTVSSGLAGGVLDNGRRIVFFCGDAEGGRGVCGTYRRR